MNAEAIREYVLQKVNVTEGFPFGEDTLVFKVNNKMFLLIALDEKPLRFNAKCNSERAVELREEYPEAILPGYHMNKKHWNTIVLDGTLTSKLVYQLIDESYLLIR